MADIKKLDRAIAKIGRRMLRCGRHCNGIIHNKSKIILPRYLVLDTEGRTKQRGSVIVGINPGQSRPHETKYYTEHGIDYGTMLEYWRIKIQHLNYYTRLKKISDTLGLRGPILWTELVKCTSEVKGETPPLETFRTCTRTFLSKELEAVPRSWPLIAAGHKVYEALSFRFPRRIVIGVPHPTGSYGHFLKFVYDRNGAKLLKSLKLDFGRLWNNGIGKAVWLNVKKQRVE